MHCGLIKSVSVRKTMLLGLQMINELIFPCETILRCAARTAEERAEESRPRLFAVYTIVVPFEITGRSKALAAILWVVCRWMLDCFGNWGGARVTGSWFKPWSLPHSFTKVDVGLKTCRCS